MISNLPACLMIRIPVGIGNSPMGFLNLQLRTVPAIGPFLLPGQLSLIPV